MRMDNDENIVMNTQAKRIKLDKTRSKQLSILDHFKKKPQSAISEPRDP